MSYVLTASVFYQRREDGGRVRYVRGDTITGLDEQTVKRLTNAGAIKPAGSKSAPKPDAQADGEPDQHPKQVAPKADWVAFAVTQGADEAEAEALTKQELVELYGG